MGTPTEAWSSERTTSTLTNLFDFSNALDDMDYSANQRGIIGKVSFHMLLLTWCISPWNQR